MILFALAQRRMILALALSIITDCWGYSPRILASPPLPLVLTKEPCAKGPKFKSGLCCLEAWNLYNYPQDFPADKEYPTCSEWGHFAPMQCDKNGCRCVTVLGNKNGNKTAETEEDLNCPTKYETPKVKLLDIMVTGVCVDETLPCCKELWKEYRRDVQPRYRCRDDGFFKLRQCISGAGCYCVSKDKPAQVPWSFKVFPTLVTCEGEEEEMRPKATCVNPIHFSGKCDDGVLTGCFLAKNKNPICWKQSGRDGRGVCIAKKNNAYIRCSKAGDDESCIKNGAAKGECGRHIFTFGEVPSAFQGLENIGNLFGFLFFA